MITGWKIFLKSLKTPQWNTKTLGNCTICGKWSPYLPMPYYPALLPQNLANRIYLKAQIKLGFLYHDKKQCAEELRRIEKLRSPDEAGHLFDFDKIIRHQREGQMKHE